MKTFIGSTTGHCAGCPDILDVWLFKYNCVLSDLTLQKEEVEDAKWATNEEILRLCKENKFDRNAYLEEVINDYSRYGEI